VEPQDGDANKIKRQSGAAWESLEEEIKKRSHTYRKGKTGANGQ
jgi:hypothetical protein